MRDIYVNTYNIIPGTWYIRCIYVHIPLSGYFKNVALIKWKSKDSIVGDRVVHGNTANEKKQRYRSRRMQTDLQAHRHHDPLIKRPGPYSGATTAIDAATLRCRADAVTLLLLYKHMLEPCSMSLDGCEACACVSVHSHYFRGSDGELRCRLNKKNGRILFTPHRAHRPQQHTETWVNSHTLLPGGGCSRALM